MHLNTKLQTWPETSVRAVFIWHFSLIKGKYVSEMGVFVFVRSGCVRLMAFVFSG